MRRLRNAAAALLLAATLSQAARADSGMGHPSEPQPPPPGTSSTATFDPVVNFILALLGF